jgi:hypothetical protein
MKSYLSGFLALILIAAQSKVQADDGLLVRYTFDNTTGVSVPDASGSGYDATLVNEASIVTMGKYKVLDLGNGTGYLDMGAAIGGVVPTLGDYTVSVYYRVDKNAPLSGDGYFLWAFSVLANNVETEGPYIAYRLNKQRFALSTGGWSNENAVSLETVADKGAWKHVLYRQTGERGQLYLDGQLVADPDTVSIPQPLDVISSSAMACNWLGRAPFSNDNYLQNTLIYDFRLYSRSVTDDEIIGLSSEINDLNSEYGSDYLTQIGALLDQAEELIREHNSNLYPQSVEQVLEAVFGPIVEAYEQGTITALDAPDFVNQLQLAIDNYLASALGLKIRYDFENVTDQTVPDVSNSGYDGTLYNEASVIQMGKYNVLSLGNKTGYVDMGKSAGNIISSMNNFTISAYYRLDKSASLSGNGHFLWAFSVLASNGASDGPYLAYRLNKQRFALSTGGWGSENAIDLDAEAEKGAWHHVVYRQDGTVGELYIDGEIVGISTTEIPIPSGAFTTPPAYNWIGRAPFSGDNYLKNTLVYDFRLYNQAVDVEEITAWAALTGDLDAEYDYGTKGDFTQLTALIEEYAAIADAALVNPGEGVGQYPQDATLVLKDSISSAQNLVDADAASQFLINEQIDVLKIAYEAFLATAGSAMVYPEELGAEYHFESGLYYIEVGNYYLTVPESGANNTYLQLRPYIGNEDKINNNQVWNIQYNAMFSDPLSELALYSIVSDVAAYDVEYDSSTATWISDGAWHLDEQGRMKTGGTAVAQSLDGDNYTWREHRIYYNGEAYSIVNDHDNAAIVFANETENETPQAKAGYKKFNFRFRAIDDVVSNPKLPDAIRKPSAITDKSLIRGTRGEIVISGADAGSPVYVYDISGRLIQTVKAGSNETRIAAVPGLYIVKVSGQHPVANKVIVR